MAPIPGADPGGNAVQADLSRDSVPRPGWRSSQSGWHGRDDPRTQPKEHLAHDRCGQAARDKASSRMRITVFIFQISTERAPWASAKQSPTCTHRPETRMNARDRLLIVNRSAENGERKWAASRPSAASSGRPWSTGKALFPSGTGKKNPNRMRVGISHYGGGA